MPLNSLLTTAPTADPELCVDSSTRPDVLSLLQSRGIAKPVSEFLSRPSKRFRAELVELAFRIAGGTGGVPDGLIDAIEVLHAGSLIIDDVEDSSTHRRGAPALHRVIGEPLAINAGNWMYFHALEVLTSLPLNPLVLSMIASRTATTVRKCHEGQALDLVANIEHLRQHEVEAVVDTITLQKTGGLMALAAWLGGVAAQGQDLIIGALDDFGMQLGAGLQMLNDLAELRASAGRGGRCDDLRNRRVTWPWAWFAQLSAADDFTRLQDELSQASSSESVQRIAKTLILSTQAHGRAVIRGTLQQAYQKLESSVGDHQHPSLLTLRHTLQRVVLSHA